MAIYRGGRIYQYSDGDVTGRHQGDDFWVIKLNNANGQLIWQKALGGSGNEEANAITVTTDGGVVVAGTAWSNDGDLSQPIGQLDGWIVKLDANGAFVWKKVVGGTGMDWANAIVNTNDGGYIIAGSTQSNNSGNIGFNHGDEDGWVMKMKSNGDVEWCTTLRRNGVRWVYCSGCHCRWRLSGRRLFRK